MSDPRRGLGLHLTLQTLLWLLGAMLVAHIGSAWFVRVDLTRDQKFSLSQPARDAVAKLDRPLVAKVFFTQGLQAPYQNHAQALRDKLEELRAVSHGRLELSFVDPTGDRDLTAAAQRFGIRPVTYTYREWGHEEARTVFMGVSFVYGDRQQAVDALPSIDQMEYELVRAIRAVTTEPDARKTVGWWSGHGEPSLEQPPPTHPLGRLREALSQRYELVTVAPGPIPDLDALLVVAPQQEVSALDQYYLDQYVVSGGAVGLFISGVQPDFRSLLARRVPHGLAPLVGSWGAVLGHDTLLDRRSNEVMVVPMSVGARQRSGRMSYPLALVSSAINREHRAVRNLKRVVAPFSTSLRVADDLSPEVRAAVWASSEPSSVSVPDLRQIRPETLVRPLLNEQQGSFGLAVALSGRFRSFFAGRTLPEADPPLDPDEQRVDGEPTRLVVVSSGDFVANNIDFVLNASDWLLEDVGLIDVRTRNTSYDPLPVPKPAQVRRLKAMIVFGPLGLLWGLGLLGWWLRRRP